MIVFTPTRGMILMCNFDLATIPPEMRKTRRVVVISPKSYNKRPSMSTPGKCLVVPFSATPSYVPKQSHVMIPSGSYKSLSKPVWAVCEMVAHVSHTRLDRVASGAGFLSESVTPADLGLIEEALKHALGFKHLTSGLDGII